MLAKVATSRSGAFVARSEGTRWIEIWDLRDHSFVRALDTTLDAGGDRFAISEDGALLLVGAYRKAGIALYRVVDGNELWRRKDVSRVQQVTLAEGLYEGYVARQDAPALGMHLATGRTVHQWNGARSIFPGRTSSSGLLAQRRGYRWLNGDAITLAHQTGAGMVLDVAFGPSRAYISEATGPLRVIDMRASQEIQTVSPGVDCHWVKLSCIRESDDVAMVRYNYETGHTFLDLLGGSSDRVANVCELESGQYGFASAGTLLIGSGGDLRRTDGGQLLQRFHWKLGDTNGADIPVSS